MTTLFGSDNEQVLRQILLLTHNCPDLQSLYFYPICYVLDISIPLGMNDELVLVVKKQKVMS